jgi:hypothetical protein
VQKGCEREENRSLSLICHPERTRGISRFSESWI